MEESMRFGEITASALITALLAVIYWITGDKIPDRFRALLAVVLGVGVGLLYIPYMGLECTIKCVVDNTISGLMIGLSAVGMYETQRTVTRPRQ